MAKMAVLKNFYLNNHIKNIKNFLRIINVRIFTIFSESKISISILQTENRNKTIFLKISTQIKHFIFTLFRLLIHKQKTVFSGREQLISYQPALVTH